MEQRGQEFNSFEEIVEKTIDAKAKAAFSPYFYACITNQHFFQDSWPSAAKIVTQGQPIKDPWVKERKPRSQEQKTSSPQRSNSAETSEQSWKEKKKKEKQKRCN